MTTELLTDAEDFLWSLGLHMVGKSEKSRSSYWSLTNDDGQPRLRLSNHAVAHACSESAVQLGTSIDDDVRLGDDTMAACKLAVAMLVDAQAAHDRESYTGGYSRDESPEDHADADESEAKLRAAWAAKL